MLRTKLSKCGVLFKMDNSPESKGFMKIWRAELKHLNINTEYKDTELTPKQNNICQGAS